LTVKHNMCNFAAHLIQAYFINKRKTHDMKKFKFIAVLFIMLALGGAESFSMIFVDLSVGYVDPYSTIPEHGKTPVGMPQLWLDGHEITFQSSHPQYTLSIVQEGQVLYSVIVTTMNTFVMLPTWITGDVMLMLVPEESIYYYYGKITL